MSDEDATPTRPGTEEPPGGHASGHLGESGPGTPGYEGATAVGEEGASAWHGHTDDVDPAPEPGGDGLHDGRVAGTLPAP